MKMVILGIFLFLNQHPVLGAESIDISKIEVKQKEVQKQLEILWNSNDDLLEKERIKTLRDMATILTDNLGSMEPGWVLVWDLRYEAFKAVSASYILSLDIENIQLLKIKWPCLDPYRFIENEDGSFTELEEDYEIVSDGVYSFYYDGDPEDEILTSKLTPLFKKGCEDSFVTLRTLSNLQVKANITLEEALKKLIDSKK